ncbi:phytase [Chitinophaga horti]|uniref:Phytase n=1 Tax=Chitinophaga horti TaxID=2920382 RepID=A0ABY6J8N2_9BACT|nr:phytase [Chitinophaga horti]UYQ94649.1 phytase [Chitinophaga horti]
MGYVYYSDETVGVRKYSANPGNEQELGMFAKTGFASDHEGISIYPTGDSTGYVLVSNQQNNTFEVFSREGSNTFLATVPVSTDESDGSDVTAVPLGAKYPKGLFVAMSNGKVFHYYDWRDIQQKIDAAKK